MPGEITDETLDVVRELVNGRTISAIARSRGVTPTAVSMRMHRLGIRLGTDNTLQTVLAVDRSGLLDKERAQIVRREVAERHAASCALLRLPVCDCQEAV